MKGLMLAGLIFAFPAHGQIESAPIIQQIQYTPQQIQQIEQQFWNDWNTLLNSLLQSDPQQQTVSQQLERVLNDMDHINQLLNDQNLVRHSGIHRLPSAPSGGSVTQSGIEISAGDSNVSQQTLQSAARIIRQISLPILAQNISGQTPNASIVLYSSRRTYRDALAQAGFQANEIPSIVAQTGGITVGSQIWIPLYMSPDKSSLANVLTHELTHVAFNQMGIGDQLPTWINEGIAWQMGLTAEAQLNSDAVQRETNALNSQLRKAIQTGSLLPLSASESDMLNASYNVEWQDYLAVKNLINTSGSQNFKQFLSDAVSVGVDRSFQNIYQMSLQEYENQFNSALQNL
ncbi:peptidase MA family metallohydrolase [Effusibacillus dendaii]|uniref:Peptidase MA-like domain-containing protein n=1 Tax=Effusibacillus dendaii TaxID=2743772 RepID=A0A7I8DFC2_9BACL|nr:peptidase MA family metallohydrolase [Effusibacillus dendaii]BCJ88002.1 hypothetical protein skT53_29870 [Effusibacillus dendaii]